MVAVGRGGVMTVEHPDGDGGVDHRPGRTQGGKRLVPDGDPGGRLARGVRDDAYPGPGGKWQVSTDGGTEPVWNPKGHELFYRSGKKLMAVEYQTQQSFSPGKPMELFEGPYVPTPRSFPDYDVSPDGQRFLMLKPAEDQQATSQIIVVQNWIEELKEKVPLEKK